MLKLIGNVWIVALFLFVACDQKSETSFRLDEEHVIKNGEIQLVPVIHSKEVNLGVEELSYPEGSAQAQLKLNASLSDKTEIRYSLNNGKVNKSSNPQLELDLLEGNNVLMAYLSTKEGLRINSDSSVIVKNLFLGESEGSFQSSSQHLFHLIPEEGDSSAFFVDTHLENASTNEEGQVKLMIDGVVFFIHPNQAYQIRGLSKEAHNFRIQLMNQQEQVIPGPFNDSGVIQVEVK